MDTNRSATVLALNDLVKINKDRFAGYQKATELTKNEELKTMFQLFAMESSKNINELTDEILKISGQTVDHISLPGKFYRAWMDMKVLFLHNADGSILSDCEYGESIALEAYKEIEDENIFIMDLHLNTLLKTQKKRILEGLSTIQRLKNMVH